MARFTGDSRPFFLCDSNKRTGNAILKTYARPFAVRKTIYTDGKRCNIYFFPVHMSMKCFAVITKNKKDPLIFKGSINDFDFMPIREDKPLRSAFPNLRIHWCSSYRGRGWFLR